MCCRLWACHGILSLFLHVNLLLVFFSPVYYCYYFLSTEYDRTRDVGGLLWGRRERAECVRRDDRISFPSCQVISLIGLFFFFLLPLFFFFFFAFASISSCRFVWCFFFFFFAFFSVALFRYQRECETQRAFFSFAPFRFFFFFSLFFLPFHRSPKPLNFFYIKWLASVAILTWSTAVNWTNGVYVLFFSSFPFYHFPRACELLLKWNSFSSSIFHSSRVL